MAVNVIKELDFHDDEMDNCMTENLDGNEESIASLLLKYSEENNNNNTNIKNNNGEDEETSGLSTLLSKFSLTKLRSQKWAKPVARFPLNLFLYFFVFSSELVCIRCISLTNFTLSMAQGPQSDFWLGRHSRLLPPAS